MTKRASYLWFVSATSLALVASCGDPSPLSPPLPDWGAPPPDTQPGDAGGRSDTPPVTSHKQIIDQVVKPLMDAEWCVGLGVGLVDSTGRTEFYGYGETKASSATAPDENSLFEMGSNTKTLTSLLLALMTEDNAVALDQPVQQLLPATKVTVPTLNGKEILLQHLATHFSGLPRDDMSYTGSSDPWHAYQGYTVSDMFASLSHTPLDAEPGTAWSYSNFGAVLLGQALGLKAGKSWEDLVRTRITDVLGMPDTVLSPTASPQQASRVVAGYFNDSGFPMPPPDDGAYSPCGALQSTMKDALKYLSAQMGVTPSPLSSAMTLTHAKQRDITGPKVAEWAKEYDQALAWLIHRPTGYYNHGGATFGVVSDMGWDPGPKNAAVWFCNVYATDFPMDALTHTLLDVAAGKTPAPLPLPPTLKVRPDVLDQYVGKYLGNTQDTDPTNDWIEFVRQGDRLIMHLPVDQPPIRLFGEKRDRFYARAVRLWITFQTGASGSYDSVLFEQEGFGSLTFTRAPGP